MVERVLSQDAQATERMCEVLSAGMFSEPGLTYASIAQAIDALGLPTVGYAAQTMTVHAIAQILGSGAGLNPFDFVRHAFATSVAAAVLANGSNVEVRRAQTGGLTHNLGILFCASAFPEEYRRLVDLLQGESTQLQAAEQDLLGFDHQDAARLVLPAFGFQPDIVAASAEHHKAPGSLAPLSKCVALGNLVADQLGCTIGIGNGTTDLDQHSIEAYGFSEDRLGLAATSVSGSIGRMSRWSS
jgi:HD-like signal output (HDOD) protein